MIRKCICAILVAQGLVRPGSSSLANGTLPCNGCLIARRTSGGRNVPLIRTYSSHMAYQQAPSSTVCYPNRVSKKQPVVESQAVQYEVSGLRGLHQDEHASTRDS